MRLDEYVKSLKKKRVTVVGAGISNRPLIKLLCANGVNVTVCDRSETQHEELQGLPIHTKLGEHYVAVANNLRPSYCGECSHQSAIKIHTETPKMQTEK